MPEVHMMCGIAGSGKTHLASSLVKQYDAVYVSSDEIRSQWYGDAAIQGDNSEIFTEIRNVTRQALHNGKTVVYDATNLSRRRRIHFIRNDVRGYAVTAHAVCPPLSLCLKRNQKRERRVREEIIHHMYKNFEMPFQEEGFKHVHYYPGSKEKVLSTSSLEGFLADPVPYSEFFQLFNRLEGFPAIYELPHDTRKHSFSVSRHLYHTLKEIHIADDRNPPLNLLWAAILHDIGKGETKSFVRFNGEIRKYAGYEGHENVGTYLTIRNLHHLGYSPIFTCSVAKLVQFHQLGEITSKKQKKLAALILNKTDQEELSLLTECNRRAN